jgi:CubicO group peptidase (beta-lactamase class C family)
MKNLKLLFFTFILSAFSFTIFAQPITSPQIDALVERTLKTFDVPGIAVAVVKDGKIIQEKG